MDFISTKEAAKLWGISQRRVIRLAGEGRINGAQLFGISWMIPKDAEKPADGRTKSAKAIKEAEDNFRFPIYLNKDEKDYIPPLSDEEKRLRKGQLAFHACRYQESKEYIYPLSEHAENFYVRLAALYQRCHLVAYDLNKEDYEKSMYEFFTCYAGDFPHKKEMYLLKYRADITLGYYDSLMESFHIQAGDEFHRSAQDMALFLSVYSLTDGDFSNYSKLRFEVYELLCKQMERDGHFYEAQELHLALVMMYQMQTDQENMLRHYRKALEIALEQELYFQVAGLLYFYPNISREALNGFPKEFVDIIHKNAIDLHENYLKFSDMSKNSSYWSILSNEDFIYISMAMEKYSNKEVGQVLNITEKAVSRHYNIIYQKLKVSNKTELVELVNRTHRL